MKNKEIFTFFWAGTFSQWAESPFSIDGVAFNTAEQYMMYKKALLFHDYKQAEKIMGTSDPRVQKQLGREVTGFDRTRWEQHCKQFVYNASYAKFTQNHKMRDELLATIGTTLVEASPEDKIWGIGLTEDDDRAKSRDTWQGTNWLGEILTDVRNQIVSISPINDIYIKLVEIYFNLQDPIDNTLENATKDVDKVLKEFEILLRTVNKVNLINVGDISPDEAKEFIKKFKESSEFFIPIRYTNEEN